jgi:hypothetical protein
MDVKKLKIDPNIANSITYFGKPYLLNAIDAVAEKKTAEYFAENAIAAMQQCVDEFDKKVFGILQ